MALFRRSLVCLATLTSCMGIFIGGEQDVGSPLRVAQCRATCLERFSNDGPNGESMCLQGPDCFMGEALKVIHSLEVSDSNYSVAWQLLKERYENKRVIINSHIKSIFELPSVTKESPVALRNFSDSLLKDIRCLKNLGQPIDSWGAMIIYLCSSKLDHVSKREWESSVKQDALPTIDDFFGFLNTRCRLLESLSASSNYSKQGQGPLYNKGTRHATEHKSFSHVSTNNKLKCFYCKQSHLLYHCEKFLGLSNQDKLSEVKRLRLCTNCLRSNHMKPDCKSQGCKICNKMHNTLLHIETNNDNNSVTQNIETSNEQVKHNQSVITTHCNQLDKSVVLLSTALIYVYNVKNQLIKCRCLLDSGSQSNFVTNNLARKLGLNFTTINIPVLGINQNQTNIKYSVKAKIKSIHNNYAKDLSFLVLDKITGQIPTQSFSLTDVNVPSDICLADPNFNISQDIDMLLGASIFYDLLCSGQVKLGDKRPILQNSELGWFISGPLQIMNNVNQTCLLSVTENFNIQSQLEKFWKLEDMPQIISKHTKDEQYCEEHFIKNYSRDNTGRFVVSLPLKENYVHIGDTLENAKKRFFHLEQKLHKNPNLLQLYSNFIQEYKMLGHMTELDDSQVHSSVIKFYLPHHGVFKDSSATTKLRVVFDGSAKSSTGISLNDTLYVGPTIQDDLFSILIRFRKHEFVIKADITKMYRQVNVNADQRNLQRIIWRNHPDDKLSHYNLNTVTYGTSSAAFLAIRSLQQCALGNATNFPKASNTILSDFYVDDLITGDNSIKSLQQLKLEISNILESGGFNLAQWMSNNLDILNQNERSELANFHFSEDNTVKTLGILWNPRLDTFQYTVREKLHNQKLTKRAILSIIAQIFDPLGLIGPVVIKAKIILQQLWKLQLDWDETMPPELQSQFLQFLKDLDDINNIYIPRYVLSSHYVSIQLHGFSDASQAAYGCCIFIRTTDSRGVHHTQLLSAKSRVAPLKVITLPRLELCGTLLLSRLVDKVLKAIKIDFNDIFLWADSKIVLAWLAKEPTTWKTFVSNRVSEIQTLIPTGCWRHVPSSDNPADLISRGCNTNHLIQSKLWWSGPYWLQCDTEHWPYQENSILREVPEQRTIKHLSHTCINDFDIFNRFSTLTRLQNVVAYCFRFIKNSKLPRSKKLSGHLTVNEIKEATNSLLKIVQGSEFSQELHDLKASGLVSRNSKLACLNPFLDSNNIIRVGGRLKNSDLEFDHNFPIVLPSAHPFTNLVILHEHIRTLHGGIQTVLSSIRTNYWPLNGRNAVRKITRKCITCIKAKPSSVNPIMGQLPTYRIKASRPFLSCGIDFAGPILIKDGTLKSRKLCWENCELLQSNFLVWGAMCEEKEICFPGCQEACRFHAEASTRTQQTQPVIHTKGEGVIRVSGALARWPRPSSIDSRTPLVYVVMRKSQSGPWRQIIQTLDHTTRVPLNTDQGGALLRVLVVDPQGLVTIYSPDEASLRENKKKKKTINTEIKATTSKTTTTDADAPWTLREVSLIHQKVLVIGEIAWEPKTNRGVYLVTWEVDGGGLKGNLFTDSTCVTLSLWPDTIYHIQVELVSHIPGVENLKSEMMDLDTGRAQKVSTETDMNIISEDAPEHVNFKSPLYSIFNVDRSESVQPKYQYLPFLLGGCAAVFLFAVVFAFVLWRCRRRQGLALDNMITGSTSIRSQKLIDDFSGYTGFQPIITVMGTSTQSPHLRSTDTPEVAFQGAHNSNFLIQSEKTVQV